MIQDINCHNDDLHCCLYKCRRSYSRITSTTQDSEMAFPQAFPFAISFVAFFIFFLTNFTFIESIGFSLKLIPPFSPESPLYPGNLTELEKFHLLLKTSKARASYLASLSSTNGTSIEPENIHLPVHGKNFLHSVEVFLGTPIKPQFLLMDTGSFLTWIQCQPCINCFNQSTPIFDPRFSSTYRKLPCVNPLCRGPLRCVGGECVYQRNYGGGASTRGVAATETFTFPYNNVTRAVPNIVFGCSNDNQNFSLEGEVSGIFGLNKHPLSLTIQLRNIIQGRFSYCLVYSYNVMEVPSVLRFGEDAVIRGRDVKTIRILNQTVSSSYHLDLLDISVEDERIRFPPGTFALQRNGSGGCMIDTGAIATFMDKRPYEIVMQKFDEHYRSFGRRRVTGIPEGWEYCYLFDPRFRAYASMTFHFQGADFKVEPAYMNFYLVSRGVFCVGLLSTTGKTILGAFQQQDTRFLYDLNAGTLQFVPENCANDRGL